MSSWGPCEEENEINKLREQYREILLFFETLGELFQRMKEAMLALNKYHYLYGNDF